MLKKILLIESDDVLGFRIEEGLVSEGFDVLWVKDGPSGIREISNYRPNVIVVDVVLNGYNGYEVLERKKDVPESENIDAIMISHSDYEIDVAHALNLGARDCIAKGDVEKIINKINTYTQKENMTIENAQLIGKKILWIEDDAFLSDIIAKKLSLRHLGLIHTISGEDALVALEKETPEIILLDILLPGMNGLDFLEKIRGDEKFTKIPVVILSNFAQKEDIERGNALGAVKFLVKATLTLDEIIDEIIPFLK